MGAEVGFSTLLFLVASVQGRCSNDWVDKVPLDLWCVKGTNNHFCSKTGHSVVQTLVEVCCEATRWEQIRREQTVS